MDRSLLQLLIYKARATGLRLAKMPPSLVVRVSHTPFVANQSSKWVSRSEDLQPTEFRYFIGREDKYWKDAATCRVCGWSVTISDHDKRTEHLYTNGCKKVFHRAMRHFVKQQECLVCGDPSDRRCYGGLPFCGLECVKDWMFAPEMSERATKVIQRAKAGG